MNSTDLSIENIDKQIEKLTNNYDDELEVTPIISQRDLIKKIKVKEIDQRIEDSKQKSLNITCKLEDLKNISSLSFNDTQPTVPKKVEDLEEEMRSLYKSSPTCDVASYSDSILKKSFDYRESLLDNIPSLEEVFDAEDPLSMLVKKLFTCFTILLTFVILFIMIICII